MMEDKISNNGPNSDVEMYITNNKEYKDFLLEYDGYHISYLKIYNLRGYKIIDLSKINLFGLDIQLNDNKCNFILPLNLTKLIVRNIDNKNCIDFINNLHSRIKYLEIKHVYEFGKTAIYPRLDYLPSSIETLVLPGDYQNNLENLPNSIKNIIFTHINPRDLPNTKKLYRIDFSYLSDFVEQMQLSKLYDYDKKIIKLPKSLKKLSFGTNTNDFDQLLPENYSCFYELDNLEYLKTNIILPNELFLNLKKLKYLNFWFCGCNFKDLVGHIPKSLEYLSIKCHMGKILNYIEYDNLEFGLNNLKYLKFTLDDENFEINQSIIIKNLPETLISLTLSANTNILGKLKISQLPKNLEYFSIKNYLIKSHIFNDYFNSLNELPSNLKYLIFSDIKNYQILPNSLIWLETNSYDQQIQKLSNLEYLTIRKKSNYSVLNFNLNTNLTHLCLKINIKIDYNKGPMPLKLFLNEGLQVLLLNFNFKFDNFNEQNFYELVDINGFMEDINFSPGLKIFGLRINSFSFNPNLSEVKKNILETYLKNAIRPILSSIPDSVEVLGFEDFCDKIPMDKFPKSLNKIYMENRASSLKYCFENESAYLAIEKNIDEYRTEVKRGEDPFSCMYRDYFTIAIVNYKKSNEYWDELFDGLEKDYY
jgi:hypothetical protein